MHVRPSNVGRTPLYGRHPDAAVPLSGGHSRREVGAECGHLERGVHCRCSFVSRRWRAVPRCVVLARDRISDLVRLARVDLRTHHRGRLPLRPRVRLAVQQGRRPHRADHRAHGRVPQKPRVLGQVQLRLLQPERSVPRLFSLVSLWVRADPPHPSCSEPEFPIFDQRQRFAILATAQANCDISRSCASGR